ncbi:MAG: hypothetical protein PVJ43_09180 [Gemmatimonadales bacterium]|jgi:hypothetical protein
MLEIPSSVHGPDSRTVRLVFWTLLVLALLLPWGTGAVVKVYLDATGHPTYPWVYYANPWTLAVFIIPSSIYWSSPLLALVAVWRLTARRDRLLATTLADRTIIALGGFLLGVVGAIRLYVALFRDIEHSPIPVSRLPLLYLPWVTAGLILGSAVALIRAQTRVTRSGDHR